MTLQNSQTMQRLRAHYGPLGRCHVDVPSFPGPDGNPWRVWFTPLTLGERDRLINAHSSDPASAIVRTIIAKATDENGAKLFVPDDFMALKTEIPAAVLSEIFNAMNAPPPSVADQEKN